MILATNWFFKEFATPAGVFGLCAQMLFMGRFVVQWFVSERRKRSTIPVAFWWISLSGGLLLFVYATIKEEPVFMLGQMLGIGIYTRNLMMIYRRRMRIRERFGGRPGPLLGEVTDEDDTAAEQTP